jgi:hypothetical protein
VEEAHRLASPSSGVEVFKCVEWAHVVELEEGGSQLVGATLPPSVGLLYVEEAHGDALLPSV